MGREQQAAGAALERDIDAFHARLYDDWYIQRNHPKDRRSKGPPDYMAVHAGHAFLFDAKASATDRWSVHLLKPHQATALERFMRAGATSGLYLRLSSRGVPSDVWIAWADLFPRWRNWYVTGRADSLSASDGTPIIRCDWTAAARNPIAPASTIANLFTPLQAGTGGAR